jgi:broad specificity phosphatase PhoE
VAFTSRSARRESHCERPTHTHLDALPATHARADTPCSPGVMSRRSEGILARMTSPVIVLVRHGETAWTVTGQHTSRTDVPLTEAGRRQAEGLRRRLAAFRPVVVLTSPRSRAMETCLLAGFGNVATTDDEVVEWDYGSYEGRTTADIRAASPDWTLWRDGVPGGESASHVADRADRVIDRLRQAEGDGVVFAHGHFLRVLAARWLGLQPDAGRLLALSPASVSVLGWEREQAVLIGWNETT